MISLSRLTRRRFLTLAGGSAAALGLYAWRIEPHWLEVVRRELPIAALPSALVGRTLLQLSDLHVGPVVDPDYLIASVQLASSLRPDLTVITGDFMTCSTDKPVDDVARVLEHLQPGELGCFAVLGNHDYGRRWSRMDVADRLTRRLAELNIRVLQNETQTIQGLQLVGLDDFWGPRFNVENVIGQVRWEGPTLTLCHNPDALDDDRLSRCRGWFLSGHARRPMPAALSAAAAAARQESPLHRRGH